METNYDKEKTKLLVDGFKEGFDIGYRGPMKRQDSSNNLPFRNGVGTLTVLWNKVMKEVEAKRYAGPFSNVQFMPTTSSYVQSPIGLVPKGENKTRLIFHLSYDFKRSGNMSVNHYTPHKLCTMKYKDLDHAVKNCLKLLQNCTNIEESVIWLSITDLKSAFRMVPVHPRFWHLFIMKATNPQTGQTMYFLDKCLAFGAARSCAVFQEFSDSLAHILETKMSAKFRISNYLDDFLAIEVSEEKCNAIMQKFCEICEQLKVPIANEKMIPASTALKFLGMIVDGKLHCLKIPKNKANKAMAELKLCIDKKKATILQIQSLTGLLNFLAKAIVPGRTFTRRMYAKIADKTATLKQHHHINLDCEFREDCRMWVSFLSEVEKYPMMYYRPFIDFEETPTALDVELYSDSSANNAMGFGGHHKSEWFFGQWEKDFVLKYNPSIEFLELYAVCVGIFIWIEKDFENLRIIAYCDN